jgi:hypothetical protein
MHFILRKNKYKGHLLKRLKFSPNGLGRILTPKSDIIRTRMEKGDPYLFLEKLLEVAIMTSFISMRSHFLKGRAWFGGFQTPSLDG